MNRASRIFMDWLFADTTAEDIARRTARRKVADLKTAATEDWKRYVREKADGRQKVKSAYDKRWENFQAELDRAYAEAAQRAFEPVDEQKRARIKDEFIAAITPGRAIAAAAIGYGLYRAAKYVIPKIPKAKQQAQRLMVRVHAYTRRNDKNKAIPVRNHWRRKWKALDAPPMLESSTAFGQLMRGDMNSMRSTANPAARAVRRMKRVAGKISNPFRRAAPRMD